MIAISKATLYHKNVSINVNDFTILKITFKDSEFTWTVQGISRYDVSYAHIPLETARFKMNHYSLKHTLCPRPRPRPRGSTLQGGFGRIVPIVKEA